MPKVATISPQNRTLDAPEELKALPAWLVWRYEQHPGEAKPRKVPYYVEGGRRFGQQGSPHHTRLGHHGAGLRQVRRA